MTNVMALSGKLRGGTGGDSAIPLPQSQAAASSHACREWPVHGLGTRGPPSTCLLLVGLPRKGAVFFSSIYGPLPSYLGNCCHLRTIPDSPRHGWQLADHSLLELLRKSLALRHQQLPIQSTGGQGMLEKRVGGSSSLKWQPGYMWTC